MRRQRKWIFAAVLAFSLFEVLPGLAQEPGPATQASASGWRKIGETAATDPPAMPAPQAAPAPAQAPTSAPAPMPMPMPAQFALPAGTWVTIHVNEPLSSDHNQPGDTFTATLAQPLVANGFVVARRGQTVAGVVAEAVKAGRAKGTSRLSIQLTEIALADGRQVQVHTRLMERRGETSQGRDAAAIGTTTGMGAAIGAAADGGFGAGMGAIAGAAASTIGVLLTRGHPTVVYPEDMLTFRLEAPVTIALDGSGDAFQPVAQQDYAPKPALRQRTYASAPPSLYYGYYGYPYYSPYFYPGYYWGPSFYYFSGPRFFSHGGGFRGGHFRHR